MSKEEFLNDITKSTNLTYTENGAVTNKSSLNALLDFFGQAGAMRNCSKDSIIRLFDLAFAEDSLRAIKCVFYLGDILEGQGERRTFRILLNHIANEYPNVLRNNIEFIPMFNRWDSIYALFDTPLEDDVISLVRSQLQKDLDSDMPSLCAKWLKSLKTSSKESRKLGVKTARLLNLTNASDITKKGSKIANELAYRKTLTKLRTKINIVEKLMSTKNWSSIDYSHVPSKAMNIYSNAFNKHDTERFNGFVDDLVSNISNINSKTLYPYEIVKKILNNNVRSVINEKLAEAQWKALPDFIENKDMKGLCVVDVSGSMLGTPMEVAISTGLYVSEKCTGIYHNKFITFSENPSLVSVKGDTLRKRVKNMSSAEWGMSTNLEAVFDLILNTAVKNNSPQTDMPDYLIIITDMEFDAIQNESGKYNWETGKFEKIRLFEKETLIKSLSTKYKEAGYELPILVFWNVNASGKQMPMTADEYGWISVSGYSPSIFKAILSEELLGTETINREAIDPIKAMLTVLDSERYSNITIKKNSQ